MSGYELEPAAGGGMREQGATTFTSAALVDTDHPCIVCGYNLRGIARSGACPECGSPVERSYQGDELRYSSPEYVAALHRGVFIVLAAMIAMILFMFAGIGLGIAGASAGFTIKGLEVALSACTSAVGFATAWGWWLLSTPDPASREGRKGEKARAIVRVATVINVAVTCVILAVTLVLPPPAPLAPTPGVPVVTPAGSAAAMIIHSIATITGFIVGAVAYFAQMYYIRWLAPRLPSARVFDRAKLLMWLGPLLCTVGVLCAGLGPLVALVMYWNMLDWVRRDLKHIRSQISDTPARS